MAGTGDTAGIGEEAGTGEVAGVTYVGRNSTISTGHQGPAKESASL